MNSVSVGSHAPPVERFLFQGVDADASLVEERSFARPRSDLRCLLYGTLVALDVTCIVSAFLIGGFLRLGSIFEVEEWRTIAIVLPTFLAIALNSSAYSIEALKRPTFGARKALEALLCASAVALVLLFYLKIGAEFSRILFGIGTLLSAILCVGARVLVGNLLGRKHGWCFSNELVIADDARVDRRPGEDVLYADAAGIGPATDDPLMLHRLAGLLKNSDRVIIMCPPERRASWAKALRGTNLNVEIAMPELGTLGAMGVGRFRQDHTLLVNSGRLSVRDRFVKRCLDLAVATVALIVLAPLMLIVAIAIAVESRGPILFRQQRVGQNNCMFRLLKFRSMRIECTDAKGNRSVCRGDSRVTRVGKFIRMTSIDELPQLFNVLMGEMSIVGPRPHALGSTAENHFFWDIDPHYFDRHAIKPGITGLAQVRGYRGETVRHEDVSNRLRADLEYVTDWNIWRDLRIICATFGVLLHPKAY